MHVVEQLVGMKCGSPICINQFSKSWDSRFARPHNSYCSNRTPHPHASQRRSITSWTTTTNNQRCSSRPPPFRTMSTSSFWSAISSAASELTGGGSAAAASPLQLTKAAGPVAGQRSVRLRELKDVMRETMRHAVQSPEQPVDELTPSVVKLVRAVERCMFHGVRKSTASGNQGGGSHFWDTVLKLEAADSVAFGSSIAMVRMLRHVNTPRGMCRAWIRMLLNQNSLEYNVGAMVGRNKHHLARSYEPHALVLDPEGSSILHNMFAALNGIGFKLTVDNPTLDQNTPSSAAGATEAQARAGQGQGGALGGGGGGGTAAAAAAAPASLSSLRWWWCCCWELLRQELPLACQRRLLTSGRRRRRGYLRDFFSSAQVAEPKR